MKGGKRALSSWNIFVKKIYREGKSTDSSYEFKDALRDASKRKGEMGVMGATKKVRKTKGRKTRSSHTRRRRHH
jgi:hypothetical protein